MKRCDECGADLMKPDAILVEGGSRVNGYYDVEKNEIIKDEENRRTSDDEYYCAECDNQLDENKLFKKQ